MNHLVYATLIVKKSQDDEVLSKIESSEKTMSFESDDVLYIFEWEFNGKPCCNIIFRNDTVITVSETMRVMHKRIYGVTMPQPKDSQEPEQK